MVNFVTAWLSLLACVGSRIGKVKDLPKLGQGLLVMLFEPLDKLALLSTDLELPLTAQVL